MADLFSDVLGFYALSFRNPWDLMKLKKVQHEDIDAIPMHCKNVVLLRLKYLYDRLAFCLQDKLCDEDKPITLIRLFFESMYKIRHNYTFVYYESIEG